VEGATLAGKHVFLCYARVDAVAVDRLQAVLKAAGITVWRDTDELSPGQDWRARDTSRRVRSRHHPMEPGRPADHLPFLAGRYP
jgi:TIR domain-containing protein